MFLFGYYFDLLWSPFSGVMSRSTNVSVPAYQTLTRLMATELEIDSNRSEEEQIKIAVMALYDEDKSELVEWAIEVTFATLYTS